MTGVFFGCVWKYVDTRCPLILTYDFQSAFLRRHRALPVLGRALVLAGVLQRDLGDVEAAVGKHLMASIHRKSLTI